MKSLRDDQELMFKIIKKANNIDAEKCLSSFLINYCYENILSQNYIEDELLSLIERCLKFQIDQLNNKNDTIKFLSSSVCGKILGGLCYKNDIQNLEDAKSIFRKGNTQLKRALQVFVMDGYVTDHIKITQTISQLYKYLILFESDNSRIYSMEDRRINLLEPMVKAINHKVYVIQWQEISLELAEIFCELFESNYVENIPKK